MGERLGYDSVQVMGVSVTDLYFDVGAEAGHVRQFPCGSDLSIFKHCFVSVVLFAHLVWDIGANTAWRVGLSHLQTSPQDRTYTDLVTDSFSGRSRLWVVDGILKWSPSGNPTEKNFKLQGEYFRRNESGNLTYNAAGAAQTDSYASRQSGYYIQSVYQFMPQWRAGYRYDRLSAGTTSIGLVNSGALKAADFPILNAYNPTRNTFMVDWSPSEFSRLRLQYARDRPQFGTADNQVFLQYIMSLGAHGAHKF